MILKFSNGLYIHTGVEIKIVYGELKILGVNQSLPIHIYSPAILISSLKLMLLNPINVHRHISLGGEVVLKTNGTFLCNTSLNWQGSSAGSAELTIVSADIELNPGCNLGSAAGPRFQ